MTQAEKFKQVIEDAIKVNPIFMGFNTRSDHFGYSVSSKVLLVGEINDEYQDKTYSYEEIIYAPDRALLKTVFAKTKVCKWCGSCYFDTYDYCDDCEMTSIRLPAWQYHGMQMFLSGDEVSYLWEYILSKEK